MSEVVESPASEQACRIDAAIRGYLELEGSTTYFLEALGNEKIKLQVGTQRVFYSGKERKLVRESWLYRDNPEEPILYATCFLEEGAIGPWLNVLRDTSEPIGRILDPANEGRLRKANSTTITGHSRFVARKLRVNNAFCHTRKFDLTLDGKVVGRLSEAITDQSMARAFEGRYAAE